MTFPTCPTCGKELGPWEASTCLSHLPALRTRGDLARAVAGWSISDLAVVALETEVAPISIYDVQRVIARDLGRQVLLPSLTALVGTDRRFCWSGRGLYGLFRHDRIPSVRTLSGVSRILLAAHDAPVSIPDLAFVLKWAGYRFQDSSLEAALHRDAIELEFRFSWSGPHLWEPVVRVIGAREVRRLVIRDLTVYDPDYGHWPATTLIERWRMRVQAGIDERARRLSLPG